MAPKFLGGSVADVKGKDRRVIMANWLASAENPYFAKNLANIVWNHFFGKGIINEVDDVRVSLVNERRQGNDRFPNTARVQISGRVHTFYSRIPTFACALFEDIPTDTNEIHLVSPLSETLG